MAPSPLLQTLPEVIEQYETLLQQIGLFVFIFVVTYAVGRVVVQPIVRRVIGTRNRYNPTLLIAVDRYIQVGLLLLAVIVAVIATGYGHVFAGSALVVAAITVAVGVAGQDVIGNIVSGIFLIVDQNFNVGDWVEWSDEAGTVLGIGFRVTRIRTADNEIITIPNTELSTTAVRNPYIGARTRVTQTVSISYDDEVMRAEEVLVTAATAHPDILDRPTPKIQLTEFGETRAWLKIRYWIADPDQPTVERVRSEYARTVKGRFDQADITISPPSEHVLSGQMTVDHAE